MKTSSRLIFALIVVSMCVHVIAQTAATPEVGENPYKSYSGGALDKIQLQNGSVFLKVPLVEFPQLGKLKLSFSLIANGSQFQDVSWCDEIGDCSYSYAYLPPGCAAGPSAPVSPSYPSGGGNVQVVLDQDVSFGECTGSQYLNGDPNGVGVESAPTVLPDVFWDSWYVIDSTGAAHSLGYDPSNWSRLQATDGSGYQVIMPYANDINQIYAPPNGPPIAMLDPDGLKYSFSSTQGYTISDAIGNTIQRSPPAHTGLLTLADHTITDSVGRQILDPSAAVADPDTSVCPLVSQAATSSESWTIPGPNNQSETYHFCYTTITIRTNFMKGGPGANTYVDFPSETEDGQYALITVEYKEANETVTVLQSVVLPNGTYWGFTYTNSQSSSDEEYGDLTSIILPSGGSINYTYQSLLVCGGPTGSEAPQNYSRAVVSRIVKPLAGLSVSKSYSYSPVGQAGQASYGISKTIVTDAVGNDTVHTFNLDYPNNPEACGASETPVQSYAGSSNNGTTTATPLRETDTTYIATQLDPQAGFYNSFRPVINRLPQSVSTYQNGQLVSTKTFGYDTLFTAVEPAYTVSPGEESYDGGEMPTTAQISYINATTVSDGIDITTTQRLATYNPNYAVAGLLSLPHSVTVSNGRQSSTTTYGYDESGSPQGYFGNLTSFVKEFSTSHISYNSFSMPCMRTDADGYTTSFYYNGTTPSGSSNGCGASVGISGASASLYVTSVQEPTTGNVSHITSYSQDFNTGRVNSITDENGNTTSYGYDVLDRLTSVQYPDGGQIQQCYTDTGGSICNKSSPPFSVVSHRLQDSAINLVSQIEYDGVGRVLSKVEPTGATIDTAYDSLGNIASISNPHLSAASISDGYTSYVYDAIGRKTMQCNPDNQSPISPICVAGNSYQTWTYNGNSFIHTDEVGNTLSEIKDSRNRLVTVTEPGGLTTNYSYDELDNLSGVQQQGTVSETVRNRSFTFDSESRLLCAANPETSPSGVTCPSSETASMPLGALLYTYDPNGNLQTKTDSRGKSITYRYDSLDRLIGKTYSDGITPAVSYRYDSSSMPNATNTIGKLIEESTSNGQQLLSDINMYAYDAMGRLNGASECTPANCSGGTPYGLTAGYDLAGNQTSIAYPDGRVVQKTYDGAGQLSSIAYQSWNGTQVQQSYLTVPSANGYDAASHLINATFGNGVPFAAAYDTRERMTNLQYGSSSAPAWSKQYAWTPNSNLQSDTNLITGVQRQYGYDALNRLVLAQDIYSNLAVPSGSNGNTSSTSSSGSGAEDPPGATGVTPWFTNPDDSNLIEDPNDASNSWGPANAVVGVDAALAPDGTMSATSVTATSGSTDSFVQIAVPSSMDYSLETMKGSVWLRSITGTQNVNLYLVQFFQGGYSAVIATSVQLTTTWKQYSVAGAMQDNLTTLLLQIGGGGSVQSGGGYFMWHPMVEDQGTAGTSVTNFIPYSQRFSTWTVNQGAISDNMIVAPDGTNTGSTLTASSGATDSYMSDSIPNPAPQTGVPVTGSVWLSVPSGSLQTVLSLTEAGTSGNTQLGQQTITLTPTWQRFQITGTTTSALDSLVLQVGGGGSITNGGLINSWGAQAELTATAGPYVPTGSVPVTASTNLTNLLPYSQQLTGSSWALYGGSVSDNTDVAPDGSYTAGTEIGGSYGTNGEYSAYLMDNVPNPGLYDGQTVTASVYLRSPSGTPLTFPLWLVQYGASGYSATYLGAASLSSQWQRFSGTATLQNGLTNMYFQFGQTAAGQTMEVWGAQMEIAPQAGSYVATSALPITSGANPTNVLPNSQALNAPSWYPNNGTVVVDNSVAPDGTQTASTFTSNGSSDSPLFALIPNPSLYDAATVNASVYLRSSTQETLTLYIMETGDQGGAIASQQSITLTPTWQRFDLGATLQNGLQVLAFQIGGGGTFGNGQSYQIWGPQFAIGTVPAPYSPTGGTVTVIANGQPGTPVMNGLDETYAYDSFGNMLQNGSFNTTYNANNQMSDYSYDAAGNLLSDFVNVMTWDAENRLSTAGGTTYIYDAEGNRVEKQGVGTTDTIYLGGEPIARYSAGQWTDLIYGPNGLLAEVPGSQAGAPVYRVTDNLGTDVGSLLADGTFVNPLDHTPFGKIFSGNTNDPYVFTGKERDTESGNDYFGARYYGSSMGRFLSPDPLNTLDLSHPQKLNRYTYANNNPLANVDVGGNCTAPAVSGGQVGICVESYIRSRFLPGVLGKLALGDNRGPNPHGGTFRTQTLLSIDPSTHAVSLLSSNPGSSCAIEGCYTGVNHSSLSKISHDDKGNTYFTLTVYGENGYEANKMAGAPRGWIEMQFSFTVNAKGEITVSDAQTKGYPSVSIYSYDSSGDATDVWQQTESGNIKDLIGPRKPAKSDGQKAIDEEAARQCVMGNPAACNN